jgi:hypothetical protein
MTNINDYEHIAFEDLNESDFNNIKGHKTYLKKNIFMISCKNQDLKVIKWVWDLIYINQEWYSILNTNIFNCILNLNKIEIQDKDNNGLNAFMTACLHNTNLDVVKWIWDLSKDKIKIEDKNNDGINTFMLACYSNTNLDIIKWIWNLSKDKIKIEDKDNNGNTALTISCWKNTNLDVVKWIWNLSKDKINIEDMDNNDCNVFMYACYSNENLDVVKWVWNLSKDKINIEDRDNNDGNAFMYACFKNPNLNVIKWVWNLSKDKINIEAESDKIKEILSTNSNVNIYTKIWLKTIIYGSPKEVLCKKQIYNTEDCPICYDTNTELVLITCGHCVCIECIEGIDTCSLCRKSFDINNCFIVDDLRLKLLFK